MNKSLFANVLISAMKGKKPESEKLAISEAHLEQKGPSGRFRFFFCPMDPLLKICENHESI